MGTALVVAGLAIIVLIVVGLSRMAWRMWRGNEELEAGGSLGHQFTARSPHKPRKTKADG